MGHRTWFKVFADKWLRGTLRQETPALRGIWADILALAADGGYGEEGIIQVAPNIGLTDAQLSAILNIPEEMWLTSKSRLLDTQRISINSSNTITIVNWAKYQSEYSRQKQYRPKVTNEGYNPRLQKGNSNPKLRKRLQGEQKENRRRTEGEQSNKGPIASLYKRDVRRMSAGHPRDVSKMSGAIVKESKVKESKVKEEKKGYGEFKNVLLSDKELQKLKARFGERLNELIEALSIGIESKGYKYKRHYATLLAWEKKDRRDALSPKPPSPPGPRRAVPPADRVYPTREEFRHQVPREQWQAYKEKYGET